jgi:hypothetical protein
MYLFKQFLLCDILYIKSNRLSGTRCITINTKAGTEHDPEPVSSTLHS